MGSDYAAQTWVNHDLTKAVNATRLNYMEAGIADHNHALLHAGLKSLTLNTDGSITTPAGFTIWPTVGVPDNAVGANNDWAVSDGGSLYFKAGGAWAPYGGNSSLVIGSGPTDHTFVTGDIANAGSVWGAVPVFTFQWTPAKSGTVLLFPPRITTEIDGGASMRRDYYVYAGSIIGVDYPGFNSNPYTGPSALADAFWFKDATGTQITPVTLTVTAGQLYTIIVVDRDAAGIAGHLGSLLEFFQSVQQLGGVNPFVPPVQGAALVAGNGTASPGARPPADITAHAESGGLATGAFSHAEGFQTQAAGAEAHVEGLATRATGVAAHAEGSSTAALGAQSHAEGLRATAILPASHAFAGGWINSTTLAEGIRVPLQPLRTTTGTQATFLDASGGVLGLGEGCYAIRGFVVARRTDVPGSVSYWRFDALVESHISASPVLRLIGSSLTLVYQDSTAAAWVLAIDSHSGLDLRIMVTGEAGKTIDWLCCFEGGFVQ